MTKLLNWLLNKHADQPVSSQITVLLLGALLFRILLAPVWFGYEFDVKTFMAWASRLSSIGLSNMYVPEKDYFLDYPPGYMYVLYIIGLLHAGLKITWGSGISVVIVKLPAMIADCVLSFVVYRLAISKPWFSHRQALGLAALIACLPTFWFNSTVWGQIDTVFICFICAYLVMQHKEKFTAATILLVLAILIKPQGLLFSPFLFIGLLQKRNIQLMLTQVGVGLATIAIGVMPFMLSGKLTYSWLIELYAGTLSSYPYASLNAFNLMALLGGNFIDMNKILYIFSYSTWGWILMIAALVYCLYIQIKGRNQAGKLFYVAFLFVTAVFVLSAKMHERYLIYGLLPLLINYVYSKDRRILQLFIAFCATSFFNLFDVLANFYKKNYFIANGDMLMNAISAANVVLFIYALWLGWKLFLDTKQETKVLLAVDIKTASIPEKAIGSSSKQTEHYQRSLIEKIGKTTQPHVFKLVNKKDVIYLVLLITIYSLIALFRLGAHESPITYMKPLGAGQSIIVDLGQIKKIERINSFSGVGTGEYTYTFSDDQKEWTLETKVKSDYAKVLTWNVAEPKTTARYVKITINQAGVSLYEVAFFEADNEKPLPIGSFRASAQSQAEQEAASKLFDEQGTVPYSPSFMNGTYFDEIYHARTAYEHLHQLEPFEWTHPPLGKILISLGISIFGLNPFGWRIVGTVFGILMIPLIYVFAKRLFGKSEFALLAGFLLVCDFMHFAQTRIATIDVYGVFFILLMFYFMYHYSTMNFYRESLGKTLIPLGLAGVTFGLGIASKWIVFYGGAGLAFILLLILIERYREYQQARYILRHSRNYLAQDANLTENPARPYSKDESNLARRVVKSFPKSITITLLWCVLTFILIPFTIYILSYIPFMQVPGPGHGLKEVFSYQSNMYNYHKNLVATHPFSSTWWQWPLMIRPIWYYQGHFLPAGWTSKIVSFGNPLIWWVGILLVLYSLTYIFKHKDRKLDILLIAYFSSYLPWIFVNRLTFIYHYFAMVPFMILIITYFIKVFLEKYPERKGWVYIYLAAVGALFILFYPMISGFEVPSDFSYLLRWMPGWSYF